MNGLDFFRIAETAFEPFLKELGFAMEPPSISGRFYRVSFTSKTHTVSVSFEPSDRGLLALVFSRENGRLSAIDDRTKTLRLADLNARYMHEVSNEERAENDKSFRSIPVNDNDERLLLKCAKEMHLVLPRYLGLAANRPRT